MRDLKIRPGMDTPKAKLKNPAPKDANSILKKHMDKRQREKEPESRDPVRYATDRVEKNMRRGASGAADASRRMIKHYRGKLRQSGEENDLQNGNIVQTARQISDDAVRISGFHRHTDGICLFCRVETAARNEVGNRTISPQYSRTVQKSRKCRPAGAWAAESYTGRESRLSAEPWPKKEQRNAAPRLSRRAAGAQRQIRSRPPSAAKQQGSPPKNRRDTPQGRRSRTKKPSLSAGTACAKRHAESKVGSPAKDAAEDASEIGAEWRQKLRKS